MQDDHADGTRRLTIKDLLIATFVIALLMAVSIPLQGIASDPYKFAATLEYRKAAEMVWICMFGILGFPLVIGIVAFWTLRKSTSPLRAFYILLAIVAALGSAYVSFVVAQACARQII